MASFRHRRLLVLGATGATGQHIVRQALDRGHAVTALARRPERLAVRHAQLSAVARDLTADDDTLGELVERHDAVVSAVGCGLGLRANGLFARATPRLVAAMEQRGPKRLVLLTAYGVGNSAPDAPLIFRLMFRFMLADIYADKAAGETLVRASALEWTLLAPVLLANTPATGRYRRAEHFAVRGMLKVSRGDAATAVLDALADDSTVGRRFLIGPAGPPNVERRT